MDFYIFILYLLAYRDQLQHIKTLIKPQPFRYAGRILRALGAIPAPKLVDKGVGATTQIIKELDAYKNFAFMISPKGTILYNEWRTGYYYIGKGLGARFMAVGLDYEKKCPIISGDIGPAYDEPVVSEYLKREVRNIVPLFPECEIGPIRNHNGSLRLPFNPDRLALVLTIILTVTLWYW